MEVEAADLTLRDGKVVSKTDPSVERFSASVSFDQALARYDIRGSIAHARMLGSVGLLAEADVEALVQGLESLAAEIEEKAGAAE